MPKEILLYGAVYDYVVADLITQMGEATDGVKLLMNTPGGDVLSGYGAIAKFQSLDGDKVIQVDGQAASMGAFMCCFADRVECLDVSRFLFHRAAYGSWIENDTDRFTDDMKATLTLTNKNLRAAMESKFTAAEWETVTGVSLDDLFSLDTRIDVTIDAKQAKKLGLVSKIIKITPAKKAEIEARAGGNAIAALALPTMASDPLAEAKAERDKLTAPKPTTTDKSENIMTAAEFKAQNPAAYAEIFNDGVAHEKDRVGAFLEYADVDVDGVKAGIDSGKNMTQTQLAKFARKAMESKTLGSLESESVGAIQTAQVKDGEKKAEAKTAEEKEIEAFKAETAGFAKLSGQTVK